jgi:hypothetical protein
MMKGSGTPGWLDLLPRPPATLRPRRTPGCRPRSALRPPSSTWPPSWRLGRRSRQSGLTRTISAALGPCRLPSSQRPPHPPLVPPLPHLHDRPQMRLGKGVSSDHSATQVKDLLLDIRCEEEQVHDLSDAGTAYVRQGSQLRVVMDNSVPQTTVEVVPQGEQPCYSRHVSLLAWRGRSLPLPQLLVPVPAVREVNLELDAEGHARCTRSSLPRTENRF